MHHPDTERPQEPTGVMVHVDTHELTDTAKTDVDWHVPSSEHPV